MFHRERKVGIDLSLTNLVATTNGKRRKRPVVVSIIRSNTFHHRCSISNEAVIHESTATNNNTRRCKRAIFSSLNATVFATRKTNPKLIEEEFTRVSLLLLFSFFLFFFSFRGNSRYRCTFLPVPTRGDNRQPSENPFHPRKLIMTDVLLPPVFYPRERARSNVSALWKPREAFTHWYHPFG